MDFFKDYSIPFSNLKNGHYEYLLSIENDFFAGLESWDYHASKFEVKLELDRQTAVSVLNVELEGYYLAPCDRCLADIQVPVSCTKVVLIKTEKEDQAHIDDDDVLYVGSDQSKLDLFDFIMELILISRPITNRYDCENDPNPKCDFKTLTYFEQNNPDSNNQLGELLRKIESK